MTVRRFIRWKRPFRKKNVTVCADNRSNSLMIEEKHIKEAVAGDKKALDLVFESISKRVYNLSLKMLLVPEDAEDASQEILIKILTRLSQFRFESSFETWIYKVAFNSLLTFRGKLSGRFEKDFVEYAEMIDHGQTEFFGFKATKQEVRLLIEEVKIGCTHGLLLCLSKKSRGIFILGDILEFNSREGAEIAGVSRSAFRKSLSRSRTALNEFLSAKCGLIDEANRCRCHLKINALSKDTFTDPRLMRFAKNTVETKELLEKIDQAKRLLHVYRDIPDLEYPGAQLGELITGLEARSE